MRLLVLFLFAGISVLSAQDLKVSFALKNRNAEDIYSFSEDNGDLSYILQHGKDFQCEIFNSSLVRVSSRTFNVENFKKKSSYLGINARKKQVEVFYFDEHSHEISALVISKRDSSYKYIVLDNLGGEEEILKGFSADGEFRIMSVPRNRNMLVLRTFRGGELVDKKEFIITYPGFYSKLKEQMNSAQTDPNLSRLSISYIDYALGNDIYTSSSNKKLFAENGKVYLTFEDNTRTNLITIDLKSQTMDYKILRFEAERCKMAGSTYGNSFILGGYLYRATTCNSQLNICIVELATNQLIRNFNQFIEEPLKLNSGSVYQEIIENNSSSRVPIESTKKYLEKLQEADVAIAANNVGNNTIELFVGSYLEAVIPTNYNNGMSPGMGMGMGMGGMGGFGTGVGISIGTGIGSGGGMGSGFGSPYGGYSPYGMSPFSNYSSTTIRKMTSLRSLVSEDEFKLQNGTPVKIPLQQMKDYLSKNFKGTPHLLNYGSFKGNAYLGYYSKKENLYRVYEFTPKKVN